MRIIATIFILVMTAIPASAQCSVGQPGLSYAQWWSICGGVVMQMCNAVPGGTAGGNCQAIATSMYQTYWASQYARPSSCNPGNRMCINGWVSECSGGQWMTTGYQC